ncbi:MAG: pilus assembly protein [Hyphomicrobiaceae bacterium]
MGALRIAIRRASDRWCRDERGAIAIFFAIALTLIFACAGVAVDTGRWFQARSTARASIDAAVLAGARSLQLNPTAPNEALAKAQATYAGNMANAPALLEDNVTFALSQDGTAIEARGNAIMATTLLQVAGIRQMTIVADAGTQLATAAVTPGGSGGSSIEISVMLDATGSMCDDGIGPCTSGTKLSGLKAAAKRLVDIAVSDDQSTLTSRIAIVPFSTRIRVAPDNGGGSMMTALTGLPATWSGWMSYCTAGSGSGGSETSGNWSCSASTTQQANNLAIMPCVTERYYESTGQVDATDRAPGAGAWLNAHDGTRMTRSWDSSDTTPSVYLGSSSSDPSYQWNYANYGCQDVDQANQVLPLTSNKAALKNKIDGLTAYGATAGALGTAWSWYTLSPEWDGIFTGEGAPDAYSKLTQIRPNGAPELRKVAILMTDGAYNTLRSAKDQDQQTVSNAAVQICSAMKAKGIEVFTVGFALDQLSASERTIAEQTLRSCGTDISHFYSTLNVQQLYAAFTDIGMKLSAIRLVR